MTGKQNPTQLRVSLTRLLLLGIAARFLVDVGIQIFNPFLTIIAAGLGTNAVVMGRLVSLRSAIGLAAPVFGALADRLGYRLFMRVTLLMGAAGFVLIAVSDGIWLAAVGMCLSGLGLATFTPTLQAYLSDYLPYERRARGLAIVEYSWALAGIVGLSLTGYLIAATNWRAPFFVLAAGLLGVYAIFATLPKTDRAARVFSISSRRPVLADARRFITLEENARSAWSTVVVISLFFFASTHLIIIHGGWLEAEYGLGAAQLGTVAIVLGIADLAGSVIVSIVGDEFGKRRTLLTALVGSLLAYALLPFFNVGVLPAVAGIALTRFFFEVSVVSTLPLLSEQVPEQRAKLLTFGMAGGLLGVTISGLTGPWAYTQFGVWGLGSVSAVVTGLALMVVLWRVRDTGEA